MGRNTKNSPSPIHARMIELAKQGGGIKSANYREIAEIVSREFNRNPAISKQAVQNALRRWEAKLGMDIYDATRPTVRAAKAARVNVNLSPCEKRAAKILGIPKEEHKMTKLARIVATVRSKDWQSGMPVKQLSEKWGCSTVEVAEQYIIRTRKKFPLLFPSRYASRKF